jgi:hypothetical protein
MGAAETAALRTPGHAVSDRLFGHNAPWTQKHHDGSSSSERAPPVSAPQPEDRR